MSVAPHSPASLPVIDIAPLLGPDGDMSDVATEIDAACRTVGFFGIVGHGITSERQARLERAAHAFFQLPECTKHDIAMANAGSAWRGWFPLGGELTSGTPDRKEGVYFGTEHAPDDPRVLDATPLHGPNLFPTEPAELRSAVLEWLDEMRPIADAVMRGIALALGLPRAWFEDHVTADPTVLFRIFHYPPADAGQADEQWGVGEHTDYGLLTLLAQDHLGGLQVRSVDGTWIEVEPTPGVIVCNLGDMLERLTAGRYRSTPHRVRNSSDQGRLSFPYFFDPSWDAAVPTLPLDASPLPAPGRWDGADVVAWDGTYGEYLTAKVAKVFPDLFSDVTTDRSGESERDLVRHETP